MVTISYQITSTLSPPHNFLVQISFFLFFFWFNFLKITNKNPKSRVKEKDSIISVDKEGRKYIAW